jgi:predicted DsbA family dithiol-disulfide isomerase
MRDPEADDGASAAGAPAQSRSQGYRAAAPADPEYGQGARATRGVQRSRLIDARSRVRRDSAAGGIPRLRRARRACIVAAMTRSVRIDFVSDVSCPWCAVGLLALEQALQRVGADLDVDLHFRAFELNPAMPEEGQDAIEHLTAKYGISVDQARANGEVIRERGAALGFTFDMDARRRVYNTFDAHRLLFWAGTVSRQVQLALKHALLRAYFSEGRDVSDTAELSAIAASAGLDERVARDILAGDRYAEEVRAEERRYAGNGISAVPSVIFNDRHLIQGGQPVEVFEQALRQLAGPAA